VGLSVSWGYQKMTYTLTGTLEKKSVTWVGAQVKKENASEKSYKYYPFGMQTANSWTRENTTGNNFLANGGTELNTTSNLYDLAYRNYDPVLGRMNGVDPVASKYSSLTPYNFSFNDPVTFADPSGADPWDQGPYAGSQATYYAMQMFSGSLSVGREALMDPAGGANGGFGSWNPGTAGGYGMQVGDYLSSLNLRMPGGGGITRDQDGNININWDRIGNRGASWNANGSNGSWSVPNEIFNPWINAWQPYDPHIERLVNRENYNLRLRYSYNHPERHYPFKIDGASLEQILWAFRDIEEYYRKNGSYTIVDFFDFDGASVDVGHWGQHEHTRVFKENGIKFFVINDKFTKIDSALPYYQYVEKSLRNGIGKGWGVDETKVPKGEYPYAISIYGQGESNTRLAILYFADLYAFQTFKSFVLGK
jgi:RHS repeat-associated protein